VTDDQESGRRIQSSSKNGQKNLGGPYKTKKQAEKRLRKPSFSSPEKASIPPTRLLVLGAPYRPNFRTIQNPLPVDLQPLCCLSVTSVSPKFYKSLRKRYLRRLVFTVDPDEGSAWDSDASW
jgi:hypothetical protein